MGDKDNKNTDVISLIINCPYDKLNKRMIKVIEWLLRGG